MCDGGQRSNQLNYVPRLVTLLDCSIFRAVMFERLSGRSGIVT